MTKHLSDETLILLSEGKLTGDRLVEALLHIESCDYCYERQPAQSPEKVIKQLLADDEDDKDPDQY